MIINILVSCNCLFNNCCQDDLLVAALWQTKSLFKKSNEILTIVFGRHVGDLKVEDDSLYILRIFWL